MYCHLMSLEMLNFPLNPGPASLSYDAIPMTRLICLCHIPSNVPVKPLYGWSPLLSVELDGNERETL